MKQCYNCGILFTELKKGDRTKEHIPAKTLFEGYPKKYLTNRKTVPACLNCNQEYSKIDDQIRDLVGFTNESDIEKKELTAKTVRKLFTNRKNLNDRLSIIENNIYLDININNINTLHIKNFKGIYTIITKKTLSKNYSIDVFSLGQDETKLKFGKKFLQEIELLDNWDISGHENIFKYKMVAIDINSLKLHEILDSNLDPEVIICGMKYNSTIVALVVGMKESMKNW